MGVISVLTSPFILSLITTAIVTFPLPLISNYTILENIPNYGFELVGLSIFLITFFLGTLISYNSSVTECNRYKLSICIKQGLRQAIYSVIIYLIVFFFPFLKSGFTDIGGNNLLWNSIGEGFILGMSNIAITITNYFSSKNDGCKLSKEEADMVYAKIEKKMQSRKKKDKPKMVKITK
jgi:hypothetical protein